MDAMRQLLGHYRYTAIALVTILTLAIVGAVVLTTTSAGCMAANKLGVKSARCLGTGPVANVGPASPGTGKGQPARPSNVPSSVPQPPANPGASANPPYNPDTSANPPYNPGASAYPPYNPGASGNPPYNSPASLAAPPLANPASGSSAPGTALSCRLPVYAGGPGSGGFIVFPGQTFVADPRSAVTVPSPSPGGPSPTPPPQYGPGYPSGWYGLTYDAGQAKWLPVPYAWVSPDGLHYAYPLGGAIYTQNVRDGSQLELGEGQGFQPLDVENDGVYVITPNQPGLWFLPFAGAAKQVATTGFWQAVSNGAAYGTPTSQVPPGATNTIERLDIRTGVTSPFFSQDGGQGGVIGFDQQGDAVVQEAYQQGNAIFIVGPQGNYAIAATTYGGYSAPYPNGPAIADSHGIWFSVGNGVVLYSNGAWYWMASIGGQLAGQCL